MFYLQKNVYIEVSENYCADNGSPSVPIRTMVGMMLLKSIYNLIDEGVVAGTGRTPRECVIWNSRGGRLEGL